MGFKLGVKTAGDRDWVSNALCFETEKEADDYGRDLFSRWTAVKEAKVLSSDEPVNYRYVNRKAEMIPD